MTGEPNNRKNNAYKAQRLPIVAECLRKGMSYRKIAVYVAEQLGGVKRVAPGTIYADIQYLLNEYRAARIASTELLVQEQLEIIDYSVEQLMEQWEKSKTNFDETHVKQIGAPAPNGAGGLTATRVEKAVTTKIVYGDPRYIAEIRAQLMEKRKLLGLYAPEKKDITTKGESINDNFYTYLKKLNVEDVEFEETEG